MSRLEDLQRFYDILCKLEQKIGGARCLANSDWRKDLPERGVYFFREPGEERTHSGSEPRIVRVGTHATTGNSNTKLRDRLRNHKGSDKTGGGNHSGSIFRELVGRALMKSDGLVCLEWQHGDRLHQSATIGKDELERRVSAVIRQMPFLWVAVEGESGRSNRDYIERNSIALLSNYLRPAIDPPSDGWLGSHCNAERVRDSGLWLSNHVNESHDDKFLEVLEYAVDEMEVAR